MFVFLDTLKLLLYCFTDVCGPTLLTVQTPRRGHKALGHLIKIEAVINLFSAVLNL